MNGEKVEKQKFIVNILNICRNGILMVLLIKSFKILLI
jgi:hypothetical protein